MCIAQYFFGGHVVYYDPEKEAYVALAGGGVIPQVPDKYLFEHGQ